MSFTGGQLQIDAQSLEGNNFSLYVLSLCSAANMCNFVRFVRSSTAHSSIHFGFDPYPDLLQNGLVKPKTRLTPGKLQNIPGHCENQTLFDLLTAILMLCQLSWG